MEISKLAKEEKREGDDRKWFNVEPDKVYPAMLDLFEQALKDPKAAESIPAQYRPQALSLKASDIAVARNPAEGGTRSQRAAVLDLARLVFTEILHVENKHAPMGVRILKNDAWKL